MSGSLDRFLGSSEEEPNDLVPEPAAPEPEPQEQEPEAPEPEPEDPESEAPAEPEEPPARDQKGRFVPLRAVEDERGKRQAAEAERDRLRSEVEAFKRQQQAPQQPHQPQQPQAPQEHLTEQQVAYQQLLRDAAQHAEEQRQIRHLNKSEARVRQEFPAEVVEAAIETFKQARALNPSLQDDLIDQADPYRWVVERANHFRETTEFARNPEAVLARKRAEWEAERAAPAAPRVSPAAGMQPSVGRARSVAGRMVVDDSDMPLGDILRR